MKQIFLILVSAIIVLPAWSKPIDENTAHDVAVKILSHSSTMRSSTTLQLLYKRCSNSANGSENNAVRVQKANAGETVYFYVFGDNNSFVMISGDDCVPPVLGYSYTNGFTTDNMPDNLTWWLDEYVKQMQYVIENNIEATPKVKQQWTQINENGILQLKSTSSVEPLLKTKWNQYAPFNNKCPIYNGRDRAPTGCVATAMAQIMNYWKYPASRTVTIPSYVTDTYGIVIPAIEGRTYDWNNMSNTYSSTNTLAQEDAVSTLMYDCGTSVQMEYTLSSMARNVDVSAALSNYFGYNGNTFLQRFMYNDADWHNILRTELDAGRPMYYSGGAHAWVCDGYNGEYFHMNFGWGGNSDGYYLTSAVLDYNIDQQIIINIKPDDGMRSFQIGYPIPANVIATLNNGTLTISGTGAIRDDNFLGIGGAVGFGGDSDFEEPYKITNIVIKSGITAIGKWAFYRFKSLNSVIIENSVTTIGDYAFADCGGLTSATISNSVKTIGDYAFADCSSLKEITIPNSVTSIGEFAFAECTGLRTLNFNATNCTTIGYYNPDTYTVYPAFANCSNITTLNIGSRVTTIPDFAFLYCSGLTSVTNLNPVPQTVAAIFNYDIYSNATLTVPYPSVSQYQSASGWKNFNKILGTNNYATQYIVSVSSNNTSWGAVTGGDTYNEGTSVTAVATAQRGYRFVNWTENGAVVSTSASYSFIINTDRTLVANFTAETYMLTVKNGTGSGSYTMGTVVNISANAAPAGQEFDKWTDDVAGVADINAESTTYKMESKNATITATYKDLPTAVTGITLDNTAVSLWVGETQQLTATIAPSDATNQNVSWSSSNPAIATVSTSGLITAISKGTASITAMTEDGGYKATCAVNVQQQEVTVPDSTQTGTDGKGTIVLSLTIPADVLFSGSFQLVLPNGVQLDLSVTHLVGDLATQLTLNIVQNADSSWTFTITPTGLRSATEMVFSQIMQIGYMVDKTVAAGTYDASINDLSFTFDNGATISESEIPVQLTVSSQTGISDVTAKTNAYLYNGRLYVDSPVAEKITVYSETGVLLYNFTKPAGSVSYPVGASKGSVLIVKGGSGWMKKAIR